MALLGCREEALAKKLEIVWPIFRELFNSPELRSWKKNATLHTVFAINTPHMTDAKV